MRSVFSDGLTRAKRALLGLFSRPVPTEPEAGVSERPYPWERSYPDGVSWDVAFEPEPIPAFLDRVAATFGAKTCIDFRGRRYRYREVADLVNRAAKGFQALGVQKGIKVALMLPNSPYAVICFYAVLKAGGTVVNVNPLYAEREIAREIADSGACILVTLDMKGLYRKAAPLLDARGSLERIVVCGMSGLLRFREKALFALLKRREVAHVPDDDRHVLFEALIDNDGRPEPVEIDPKRDIAALQYTGGTTGVPKGAELTHANLYANTRQIALWAPGLRPGEEKILGVLPLFHAFGMTAVMNLGIHIGAELILLPHFKPAEVVRVIHRMRPTVFIGVPTMYSALNACDETANHDLSSLVYCISGGAPLPAAVHRRFEEITGCRLVEGYGLSETSPVCTVNPLAGVNKVGSVGLPLPGTVIEIVALDEPERLLPPGEKGEVCVRGPQVMAGYANRARDTLEAFRGGHLHTGDIGYFDDDGYLYIVDRIKDLILCGGFNVYPRMVEEVIHLHPAVEEVAVCGMPDRHRGEVVKAFVKLREGESLTASELRAFLKDKLAPFQMPRRIVFRERLPKTAIGKIDKKTLLAAEAAAAASDAPEEPAEEAPAANDEAGP